MPETPTARYDGAKIRSLRKQAGLTLVQLGERTGRHPMALQAIESGRKNASRAMILGIANALGVDVAELMEDDASSSSESRRAS